MIQVKKGEIYYFIHKFLKKTPIEWAILQAGVDYTGAHGLGAIFNVLDSNNEFTKGAVLSANQLNGINIRGFKEFISKDKTKVIKMIFEGTNE